MSDLSKDLQERYFAAYEKYRKRYRAQNNTNALTQNVNTPGMGSGTVQSPVALQIPPPGDKLPNVVSNRGVGSGILPTPPPPAKMSNVVANRKCGIAGKARGGPGIQKRTKSVRSKSGQRNRGEARVPGGLFDQLPIDHTWKPASSSHRTFPFSPSDRILEVGSGNFSFAESMIARHDHSKNYLAASIYKNEVEMMLETKPRNWFSIKKRIDNLGEQIMWGVDVFSADWNCPGEKPKVGIFNFPHAGAKADQKENDPDTKSRNMNLIKGAFGFFSRVIDDDGGVVAVSVKPEQYGWWRVEQSAQACGWKVVEAKKFPIELEQFGYHAVWGDFRDRTAFTSPKTGYNGEGMMYIFTRNTSATAQAVVPLPPPGPLRSSHIPTPMPSSYADLYV